MESTKNRINISSLAQKYINERPALKECLQRGLINYSALAREICDTYKIEHFQAIVVAARRISGRLKKRSLIYIPALELIKKARILLRTRIVVVTVEPSGDLDKIHQIRKKIKSKRGDFNLVEGEESLTMITNESFLNEIKETFRNRIIKYSTGLSQITMIFDKKLESTPGVVALVYSLLAERGINIMEELSCWTDLHVVLKESEASKAFELLQLNHS